MMMMLAVKQNEYLRTLTHKHNRRMHEGTVGAFYCIQISSNLRIIFKLKFTAFENSQSSRIVRVFAVPMEKTELVIN